MRSWSKSGVSRGEVGMRSGNPEGGAEALASQGEI